MSSPLRTEQPCRLTVVTKSTTADIAVPTNVPVVELIPSLVSRLGDLELARTGAVLQRWGDEPLDENRTASMLGLHDGETLLLRPRTDVVPAAEFDDLVDAITSTTGNTADQWRGSTTRTLMRITAIVPLALTFLLLVLPAGSSGVRQAAALSALLLTALSAVAAGRAFGDRITSLILASASLGYAALFGALTQAGAAADADPLVWMLTAPAAIAAGSAVLVVSLLLLPATGDFLPVLVPTATLGGLLALFGLLAGPITDTSGAAAIMAAVVLVFIVAVPMVSFRLARLQLPSLPDTPESLSQGVEPLAGGVIIEQIKLADRCVTGLLAAVSVIAVLCVSVLVSTPGWAPAVLVGLAAALQLMRSRLLRGVAQRFSLLCSGIFAGSVLVVRLATEMPPAAGAFVAVGVAVMVAVGLLMSAVWFSSATLAPYWGRAAEILEWIFGAAVIPIGAVVLDLYGWAHGLGG